ncbi:hypothetical protein [Uliginosibacterium gangwonense]|uniref:hypothetical protein n=1 Tax=Uliginosibacterium gangwonense TaxID=392736 RepID=UPI00047805FC|nr:hypothetical protein [Uliginosibacterium gangwonense]
MNREAIYSTLWSRVSQLPGFVTASRRLRHWADVDSLAQPALFMVQGSEEVVTLTGEPSRWRMTAKFYLYARTDGDIPAGVVLNPLLDSVCVAVSDFNPITGRSTLPVEGVSHCRVEGVIQTDEGSLGDQAVAIVPVVILVS